MLETKPEIGRETAIAVYKQITEDPESHDQTDFENFFHCKTTRCVAGWAQFFHEGRVCLANIEEKAMQYLGISYYDAGELFFQCSNDEAVIALRQYIDTGVIDWQEAHAEAWRQSQ